MARYNVLDRETAARYNITTNGEYNQHVLVTMKSDSIVDGVVCWGFKRENLQTIADQRNEQIKSLGDKLRLSE